MPRMASNQFWFFPVKFFSIATPIFLLFILIFRKIDTEDLQIGCFFLITNFSVTTSGYIFLIYLILLPYLFEKEKNYKKLLYLIIIIFCLPIDWISIHQVELPPLMDSYLGGIILNSSKFNVGLGSILRPLLNYFLMLLFIYIIFIKTSRANLINEQKKY